MVALQNSTQQLFDRGIARIPGLDALLTAGARVLVLGCGDGELLARLMHHYPRVTATVVDDDPQALAAARSRVGDGVAFVERRPDAYEPAERGFDLVLAHFTLERCGGIEQLAQRAFPAVRERGLLVISDTRALEGQDVAVLDRHLFWEATAFNLGSEHRIVHGSR